MATAITVTKHKQNAKSRHGHNLDAMATSTSYRVTWLDPLQGTILLTAVAYLLVIATFMDLIPWYPELTRTSIDNLSHAIAVINSITVIVLLFGWYAIRHERIRQHATAMLTSVGLILAFLVMYLIKIGGGGQKEIVGAEGLILSAYLLMLAIHILLSIVAVPLVIFVLLLALSRPISQLYETNHARVGRIAVTTWLLSLVLGVVTYLLLNHIYEAQLA